MFRRPSQVTNRDAVLKAIAKCDALGRDEFRQHYGYGKAVTYFLRYNGRSYDSKAIVGVAFGYQHNTKPLRSDEFSGGAVRVVPVLARLGFIVADADVDGDAPPYRSHWLSVGQVYTRELLRGLFGITDATLNNGIFKPRSSRSIWLFVTENKTADRPQLDDRLEGDTLLWSGQPAGRTDRLIIEHLANGDEILLFYRRHRSSYPGGGFRYEGPFNYRSHKGSKPTSFTLLRDLASNGKAPGPANALGSYDPTNSAEGRAKILAEVTRRLGQPKFRKALIAAYGGRCAVTGCDFLPILEAAHICPYNGEATNHVTNGLLLRADLHTLFDLGLIAVNEDHTLDVGPHLAGTDYMHLTKLTLPKDRSKSPSPKALAWHREHVANDAVRATLARKLGLPAS